MPVCNRTVSLQKCAIVPPKLSNRESGRTATASNVSWNVIKAHFRGNIPNEIAKLVLEVKSKSLVLAMSPKVCQIM